MKSVARICDVLKRSIPEGNQLPNFPGLEFYDKKVPWQTGTLMVPSLAVERLLNALRLLIQVSRVIWWVFFRSLYTSGLRRNTPPPQLHYSHNFVKNRHFYGFIMKVNHWIQCNSLLWAFKSVHICAKPFFLFGSWAQHSRRKKPTRRHLKQALHSLEAWFFRLLCRYSWFWPLECNRKCSCSPNCYWSASKSTRCPVVCCCGLFACRYSMLPCYAEYDQGARRTEVTADFSPLFGLTSFCQYCNHEIFVLHLFRQCLLVFKFNPSYRSCSDFGH